MRKLLILAFALAAFAGHTVAQEAGNPLVRQAIEGQLKSILADDDAAAYGYAAPNIRQVFPDVGRFMDMVKNGYKPVHRPKGWNFGRDTTLADGTVVQELMLTDQDGREWQAIYMMQLQADGSWKIAGVSLRGLPGLTM